MVQDRPGSRLRSSYRRILDNESPDILAFPEYYFVESGDDSVLASCYKKEKNIQWLSELSTDLNCIVIGGSIVEHENGAFVNRSYIMRSGQIVGYYDKIHPYDNEGRGLIRPGTEYRVFEVDRVRIGLLICADVLYPASFANIRGLSPDIIFVPTTSPFRRNESVSAKFRRDQRLFARGARLANSWIFKVCASDNIIGHRLQARSLIASPGKIEWRIEPEWESASVLIRAYLDPNSDTGKLDIRVYRD